MILSLSKGQCRQEFSQDKECACGLHLIHKVSKQNHHNGSCQITIFQLSLPYYPPSFHPKEILFLKIGKQWQNNELKERYLASLPSSRCPICNRPKRGGKRESLNLISHLGFILQHRREHCIRELGIFICNLKLIHTFIFHREAC